MASDKPGFFEELKRRHVWRMAIAYAVAGWLIVQIATQVFPFFNVPNWGVRLVVILVVIGFPVAVAWAWIYELTPEGVRRTASADSPEARPEHETRQIGRKLNAVIVTVLALAVALLAWRLIVVRHGAAAAKATHLVAHAAPADVKDLFALQDAITHSVAGALKAKLLTAPGAVVQSDRPPSGNLAAYAAYQHGVAYDELGTEAGERAAIAAYHRATKLDPRYAAAYASLASAWYYMANLFGSGNAKTQAMVKARAAVATALKLDPDSAQAHRSHARLLLGAMDWTGAEAEYRRARQLAPTSGDAMTSLAGAAAALSHNQRAVDLTRRSLASNPRNAVGYTDLATYLAALGQLDAARKAIDTAIALQLGAVGQYATLAMIEIQAGNAKAALAAAQKEPPGPWHGIAMALALQVGPDHAAADAALQTLIAKHAQDGPYQIAEVYALRGDVDNTFKWLDRAFANRDNGIAYLLSDPFILRYRDDPRFAAFCKKVGLPTTTDAVAMK